METITAASVSEPEPQGPKWEKKENPQAYDQSPYFYVHKQPARHILGLVGGNEVSVAKSPVDVESDLRGLNLPNTFCPSRAYQPATAAQTVLVRKNTKGEQKVDVTLQALPAYQLWGYPVVLGPEPLQRTNVCTNPERY